MRLKDGFQTCQRCDGDGCYWCGRQGWRAQCPQCANSEASLVTKNEDGEITCSVCGAVFEKNGDMLGLRERLSGKPV